MKEKDKKVKNARVNLRINKEDKELLESHGVSLQKILDYAVKIFLIRIKKEKDQ